MRLVGPHSLPRSQEPIIALLILPVVLFPVTFPHGEMDNYGLVFQRMPKSAVMTLKHEVEIVDVW